MIRSNTPSPASDVSVIIAVRNGARYLTETLDSVLAQTHPPAEIIVVDDASTDGSGDLASNHDPSVRVLSADGVGPEGARNVGILAARQPVIAFCDADDLWHPPKLELQRTHITDVTFPTVVWAGISEFVSPELAPGEYTGRAPRPPIANPRLVSALMATRVLFLGEAGSLMPNHWITWVAALPDSVRVAHVAEHLVERRLHNTNNSRNRSLVNNAALAAARIRMQQRRGQPS